MTPEAQRIALAEWDGYHYINGQFWVNPKVPIPSTPPDYLHDLNAVAELEGKLIGVKGNYGNTLLYEYQVILGSLCKAPIIATAAQRCEALLRTIGLWKD
jgi:ABC-type amino acid transport substrate-binding protein